MEAQYAGHGIPTIRIEPESSSSASIPVTSQPEKDVYRDQYRNVEESLSRRCSQPMLGSNHSERTTCNNERSGLMKRKSKPPQVLELRSPGSDTDQETSDFLRPPTELCSDNNYSEANFDSNSKWKKLRTTVKTVGAVKSTSSKKTRKQTLERQDSFLKRFSTRHCGNNAPGLDTEHQVHDHRGTHIKTTVKRHRSVIHPDENFMFYWLAIITMAVLYNVWTCIARQAFRDLINGYEMVWFITDGLCDFIYVIDILVQLRTGYLERGLIVYDSKKLARHYIYSRFFIIDLLSVLPLDVIQFFIGIHPVIRFPRFLKIYRTYRFVYVVETRTSYPNFWRVLNLSHILFLGSHWFAAFYFMISKAEGFEGTWGYPKPVGEFASVTRKYLKSLYWSTLTLTTIGDLPPPESNWEYVFTIVSYLIGVFVFATIVGQVGNVITNRNASRQEFERLLDGAKSYMRNHNVPQAMQRRVQRWYDYAWSRGRMNGGGDINSLGLLPDKLKTELALHVNLETLKKVTIFQECEPEFLHDLVLKMRAFIFTPGDLICRKGEIAREMFIIADGLLEVISDSGEVLTQMSAGDFFGEIGILNLDGGVNRRTADVRSVGYAELFVLSRDDVLSALNDHPEAEALITDYGCRRLQELGAYRHKQNLVREAQERHENKSDTVETMLASSKGLIQGVMSMGLTLDTNSRTSVQRDVNGRRAAKSCDNSLLTKIIQYGRSQAAADGQNTENSDLSHCSAARKLGEIGEGGEQDAVDIQSPDVFLVPMDTEESDVDMTTPLCEEQVKAEFPARSSSTDSPSSRSTSDLMCLDSGDDGPSARQADPDLPDPVSPSAGDRRRSVFPPHAAGEVKWPEWASLDDERHPDDGNKLRKVKSEGFHHPSKQPRQLRRRNHHASLSDNGVEVITLKNSASYERRMTVQQAVVIQPAVEYATLPTASNHGVISIREPAKVVFIVGDRDSSGSDQSSSNETLEVLLSEKDLQKDDESMTQFAKDSRHQGATPSDTSSNSSIFPACSPNRSLSDEQKVFGGSCSDFMHILHDENNSGSQRSVHLSIDNINTMSQVCDSGLLTSPVGGHTEETAGDRWHITADCDTSHKAVVEKCDGDESDDELIDAVKNVFHHKMVSYKQKYESHIKKLEDANREKDFTIQQLQATINSLMYQLEDLRTSVGGAATYRISANRPEPKIITNPLIRWRRTQSDSSVIRSDDTAKSAISSAQTATRQPTISAFPAPTPHVEKVGDNSHVDDKLSVFALVGRQQKPPVSGKREQNVENMATALLTKQQQTLLITPTSQSTLLNDHPSELVPIAVRPATSSGYKHSSLPTMSTFVVEKGCSADVCPGFDQVAQSDTSEVELFVDDLDIMCATEEYMQGENNEIIV